VEEGKNWKCTNMHNERDETVLNKELLRGKYIQIIQRENNKKWWRQEIMILEKYISKITIYAPMIYTVRCVMFLMRPAPLQRRQVGGGWALEIESFLGPVKWHRAHRRVPFGAQKTQDFQGPTPSHLPK
jgi:hypothetical protein